MLDAQVIAEDTDIPPGPQSSAALSEIELGRLSGFDCVRVLQSVTGKLNHDQAALMAAIVEVGLCGPALARCMTFGWPGSRR